MSERGSPRAGDGGPSEGRAEGGTRLAGEGGRRQVRAAAVVCLSEARGSGETCSEP